MNNPPSRCGDLQIVSLKRVTENMVLGRTSMPAGAAKITASGPIISIERNSGANIYP